MKLKIPNKKKVGEKRKKKYQKSFLFFVEGKARREEQDNIKQTQIHSALQ